MKLYDLKYPKETRNMIGFTWHITAPVKEAHKLNIELH